jgi:hypothetical protein
MTRLRTFLNVLVVAGAGATAACNDDSSTTGPSPRPEPEPPQLAQSQGVTLDPLLTQAQAVPGFGGFFLDQGGRPTVYLKDPGQRGAAEQALAGTLRALGKSPTDLTVMKGTYEYRQLHQWFTRAQPEALAVPGAVFADLDEGSNRLRLGVESGDAETRVRGTLARLGIPSEAVVVERTEPIHMVATLRNVVTPRRGGLQISFGSFICTLGFNTVAGSGFIITRSFITNSHCTNVRGGVESTKYHQPVAPNFIGTEVSDPAYFTGIPCPAGRKCRFSDAARARYATGVGSDLGGIARTTFRSVANGSIIINGANPYFNITSEVSPIQGVPVNKVGRTTGWTYGTINGTCIAANVSGTNITLLCQSRTAAGVIPGKVGPGDSGSPVFYWGGGSNVALVGLLWGGNSSGTSFVFSSMSGIEHELGALRTF